MPMISDDEDIDAVIDGTPWVGAKMDALKAHASQVTEDGPFFSGAKVLGDAMWSHEYYRFVAGVPFPASDGWADDLFVGLS